MAFSWTENQSAIIKHRKGDLLVAAGAGSGKTAVLVEHIIDNVLDENNPIDVDRLLVLTYTKAAAAEMKDRVRKGLEERLLKAEDDRLAENIRKQLTLINTAQISTIDSFCQQVLKEQFFKVDLDPGFSVADDAEMELLKNDLLQSIFDEGYEKAEQGFISLTDKYGKVKGDDELKILVKHALAAALREPEPDKWFDRYMGVVDISWIDGIVRESFELIKIYFEQYKAMADFAEKDHFPPSLIADLKQDVSIMESIQKTEVTGLDDFTKAIANLKYKTKSKQKKTDDPKHWENPNIDFVFGSWRDNLKKKIKAITSIFTNISSSSLLDEEQNMSESIDEILKLGKQLYAAYQAEKKKENQVDFADMEQMVWKLFIGEAGEPTETAIDYSHKFDEILVDEYQDCNKIQEDILTAISRKDIPNRFMVGDVKQSIYGFRGGKPDIFLGKYDSFREAKDELYNVIELKNNFRSCVGVLEGINILFSKMMIKEKCGIDYANDACLLPDENMKNQEGPDVEIDILDVSSNNENAFFSDLSPLQKEACMVAAKIRDMIEGGTTIIDRETKEPRLAGYGDVAILLRSVSTNAAYFMDALKSYGISAYSESEKGYYASLEVTETLDFLNILDNPYQDIALLGVLRGGYVGLSLDELACIKLAGRDAELTWLYDALRFYAELDEEEEEKFGFIVGLAERVRAFLKLYDDFRAKSEIMPLSELITELLDVTGYTFYALALPGGRKRVQNLNSLKVKARDYENTRFRGIFKFLRYIEQLKEYEMDISTPSLASDSGSVVIMTIHKSKGLEFPICFLCNATSEFSKRDYSGKILVDESIGIGTEIIDSELGYKLQSVKKECIINKKKDMQKVEEQRLLYVALTRARDRLIVTGHANMNPSYMNRFTNIDLHADTLSSENVSSVKCYMDWIIMSVLSAAKRDINIFMENGSIEYKDDRTSLLMKRIPASTLSVPDAAPVESYSVKTRELSDDFRRMLDRTYPYAIEQSVHSVYTVSELKKSAFNINDEEGNAAPLNGKPTGINKPVIKSTEKITGAQRGTLYHFVMECLEFRKLEKLSGDELLAEIENQIKDMPISDEERAVVKLKDIQRVIESEVGRRMCVSDAEGNLYKEQEFVLSAYPHEIKEIKITEVIDQPVLIQGIIDLVFKENDEWILVDYKTDHVGEAELKKLYTVQLDYYKKAWENITHQPISVIYIYSFHLGKFIKVNDFLPIGG